MPYLFLWKLSFPFVTNEICNLWASSSIEIFGKLEIKTGLVRRSRHADFDKLFCAPSIRQRKWRNLNEIITETSLRFDRNLEREAANCDINTLGTLKRQELRARFRSEIAKFECSTVMGGGGDFRRPTWRLNAIDRKEFWKLFSSFFNQKIERMTYLA